MVSFLKSKLSWLAAPVLWGAGVLVIFVTWLLRDPEWIFNHFDLDGSSPVEASTVAFFYLVIALLWLFPLMRSPKRELFWKIDFSLLTLTAICRELDWHKLWVTASTLPGATYGTPFKLKFLTNPVNPLGDRLLVLLVFILFFLLAGGTLLFFIRRLWKGLLKFHPVCWSIGFFGGTCILVQFFDRFPSILRKKFDILLNDSGRSLMVAFEEGFELLLPLYLMLAIFQAYLIYRAGDEPADPALSAWKEL